MPARFAGASTARAHGGLDGGRVVVALLGVCFGRAREHELA